MNSSTPPTPNLFVQAYLYGVAEDVARHAGSVEQALSTLYQPKESLQVHTPLPVSFSSLLDAPWLSQSNSAALLCAPMLVSLSAAMESITARVDRGLAALKGSGVLGLGLAMDLTGDQGAGLVLWEGQSSNLISFNSFGSGQVAPPNVEMSLEERLQNCQALAQQAMAVFSSTSTFQDKAALLMARIQSADRAKRLNDSLPHLPHAPSKGMRF